MIEVSNLSKTYGDKTVLNNLNFKVQPGVITGFVGPNGAGKSTTMKIIMGLERASGGQALIDGVPFSLAANPARTLGCCLGPDFLPERMRGADYLAYVCKVSNIPAVDIASALEYVGLEGAGKKRIADYSLGMKQRLGIAAALLGNPDNIMFDEPINGLDVDAIRWVREVFIQLAKSGKTVFVSSHIMSELEKVADRVIIIQHGSVVSDGLVSELEANSKGASDVIVKSEQANEVANLFKQHNVAFTTQDGGKIVVSGMQASDVGKLVFENGLSLYHLENRTLNLEDVFMETKEAKNA